MKIHLIYDNNLISTQINKSIKVKDLCLNLKRYLSEKDTSFTILDENQKPLSEEDMIIVQNHKEGGNEMEEKKFYAISNTIFKKKSAEENKQTSANIDELIMKVTGAKEKIKKQAVPKQRINDRMALIQAMTQGLGAQGLGGPGQAPQINQLMSFLRNLEDSALDNDVHVDFVPHSGANRLPVTSSTGQNAINQNFGYQPYHAYQPQPVIPNENYVRDLKEMGFPEDRCRRALIMARNNMSRATDLLLNDELDYLPSEGNNQGGDEGDDDLYDDEYISNDNSNNQGGNTGSGGQNNNI
jgi:hypothetical protein